MIPAHQIALSGCVIGIALLLSGCESGGEASPVTSPPAGYGAIVGGIEPCSGSGIVLFAAPTPLGFAAGTVIVMGGGTEVTSTQVAKGGQYRFTLLPGAYVLLGLDDRGGPQFAVPVTLKVGQVVHQDIPNRCI
jgi:hypothetical protein